MKKPLIFPALAVLAAVASFGISSRMHSRQALPQPCSLKPLAEYLTLTSEQVKRIEPVFAEHQRKRIDALHNREEAVTHLLSVLRSPNATGAEIDKAAGEVDAAQSRLRRLMVDHLQRLKSLLTPVQREKLFDLVGRRCLGGACLENGSDPGERP